MSINWDLYNTRLNLHGITERDRIIKEFQTAKLSIGIANPSCKTVTIDGVEKQVLINSKKNKTEFSMSPINVSDEAQIGGKVIWDNKNFLVVELSNDKDVYIDLTIQQCNYLLPYQLKDGTIIREPCIVEDVQNTSGVDQNNTITVPNSLRKITLQYNNNTKQLCEDKRIFIDVVRDGALVYKITKIDTVTKMDNGIGLWILYCKADGSYNQETDNLDLLIANYHKPIDIPPTPLSTDKGTCVITHNNGNAYSATDVCSLKVGGTPMPFNAMFKDVDGNILSNEMPVWSLENLNGITESDISVSYDNNYPMRVYLSIAKDTSLIGATFGLVLKDKENKLIFASVNCKVVKFV